MRRAISSLSDLVTGTPATSHQPLYHLSGGWKSVAGRVFDVRAFGATGDGITDDTAAIQAALDACGAAGGGTVWVPEGDFLCNTVRTASISLVLEFKYDNVWLCGTGPRSRIFSTASAYLLWIHGGNKPAGYASWATYFYPNIAGYTINAATRGAMSVTTATAGNAANFAAGDLVHIYTGNMTAAPNYYQNPDSEMNEVVSVNAGTGVITLARPLTRKYDQEYYVSGTTGTTSTSVTANLAPLGIRNVTAATLVNIQVTDLTIETTSTNAPVRVDGIKNFRLERNVLIGPQSIESANNIRPAWICDNTIKVTGGLTGTTVLSAATGSSDVTIARNVCWGNHVLNVQLNEGASDVWFTDNVFHSAAKATADVPITLAGRPRRIYVLRNTIRNGGTGAAITIAAGNDPTTSETSGVVAHNIIEGAQFGRGIDSDALGFVLEPNVYNFDSGYGSNGYLYATTPSQKALQKQMLMAWVTVTNQTATLGKIPYGAYVTAVHLQGFVAFDDTGTDTVSIGTDDNHTRFSNAVDVSTTGVKAPTISSNGFRTAEYTVKAYYAGQNGNAANGKALAGLEYVYAPINP